MSKTQPPNEAPITPPPEAPAAPAPAITPDAIAKLISDQVAAAVKPLHDQLAGLKPAAAVSGKSDAASQALTAEAVAKIVGDKFAEAQASQASIAARSALANDKLKDLPQTYRDLLPNTGDQAQLAAAEQTIRARYRAEIGDKAAVGFNVGGSAGGQAAKGQVDVSKLSPAQKIEYGLKQQAAK